MNNQDKKQQTPPVGTGPGSSGIENADLDRDVTADAEMDKSAEAPGNDPAKVDGSVGKQPESQDTSEAK